MGASGGKRSIKNGGKMGQNGRHRERDTLGRFVRGHGGGPGRPRNPYDRKCAELRGAFVQAVTANDVKRMARKLIALAAFGDPVALRLFCAMLGPLRPIDPDYTDADELEVRRARPKPVDWMLMELEENRFQDHANGDAGTLAEDLDAEALDEEPEAEDTPKPEPDPDDPLAAWEQFMASRVE
jgi:hypothetical protein